VSRRSCCGVQEQEEEVVGVQEEEQQEGWLFQFDFHWHFSTGVNRTI
jgi:hypothetical protein